MRSVSLKEANQQFAKLISDVERGERIVLTRRGKPVARILPEPRSKSDDSEWRAAYDRMLKSMRRGYHLGGLQIDRDEIHERR